MKVYISYEAIGATGHVSASQQNGMTPMLRTMITREINAAIQGAGEVGATEFLVNTGCPPGRQVLIDDLDERAEVILGSLKPDQTMAGIDETFDAVFLLNMHGRIGIPETPFSESWDPGIYSFRINGRESGEVSMNAYFAGAIGIPVVMVSGDQVACEEGADLISALEVAPTKVGLSRCAAREPHPKVIMERIRTAARRGIEKCGIIKPVCPELPLTVDIIWVDGRMMPWYQHIPTVEITGPRSIRLTGKDYREIHRLFIILDMLHAAYRELEAF